MIIGIISDTHDRLDRIDWALGVFRDEGVELLIHAGDFVAPFTLKPYLEGPWEFIGIFGNNDGDQILLDKRSGGKIRTAPHVLHAGGRKIVVTHYPDAVDVMAEGPGADVVIYGHTHTPEIRKVEGGGLIINPGECCGWSTGRSSIAVLDTDTMIAKIVDFAVA